jgi:uncharacterized protein YodC (DUF2158 family)
MTFLAGSTVRLKSEGPITTVEKTSYLYQDKEVLCCWFDGGSLHRVGFAHALLEQADAPPPARYR